jgi:hypothetical protein
VQVLNPSNRFLVGLSCVVLFFAAALVCKGGDRDSNEEELARLDLESTVLITGKLEGRDQRASGIIIGKNEDRLYIVTASHCVRHGQREITELKVTFRSLPGEPVGGFLLPVIKHELDFALIAVDRVREQQIREDSKGAVPCGERDKLQSGEPVYSIGLLNSWPEAGAQPERLSRLSDYEIHFTSSLVRKGYSGGALFNSSRHLIGMITEDEGVAEQCVAIAIDTIVAFIDEAGYRANLLGFQSKPNPAPPAREGNIVGTWERRFGDKVIRITFTPDGQWRTDSSEFPSKPSYNYHYLFEPELPLLTLIIIDNGPKDVFREVGRPQWFGADNFTYTVIHSTDKTEVQKIFRFERVR